MSDSIDRFFAHLQETTGEILPVTPTGVLRFDLVDDSTTTTWFVTMRDGRARVKRTGGDADCVVEMQAADFEGLLAGRSNSVALLFRGVVSIEGDLKLYLLFRRLLPKQADSGNPDPDVGVPVSRERDGIRLHEWSSVFHGNMFMISGQDGNAEAGPTVPLGLFFFDTRFLSTWRLSVDDQPLASLSVDDVRSFESKFALVPGRPAHYVNTTTSILRHRWLRENLEEEITLFNFAPEPVRYTVRLDVGADFAEIKEVHDGFHRQRTVTSTVDQDALRLHYRRQTLHRETVISSSQPAHIDEQGFTFTVTVDSHGTWSTRMRVLTLVRDLRQRDLRERLYSSTTRARAEAGREIDAIVSTAPRLRADHEGLSEAYECSVRDLAALYYQGLNFAERLPATGLPWSMTLLGRESLVSSFQALPFLPDRAVNTLRIMALAQGARHDPFRAEQPGRIVQESRYGESAAFDDSPEAADFGAVDTTPWFVILLDEYERWTGDADLIRRYEVEARAAVDWLDTDADPVGTGYVWSDRRETRAGPVNESWRSSAEGICFHDGRLATYPHAVCEVQGYTYDAKLRAARLARRFWNDRALADRLEREAADLRERFNSDFWLPDRGYYALALQTDGTPVDALASNVGHLLFSGIVEPAHAERLVGHLLGPALFSGWGVRSLAATEGRFSPLGQYTGAVWPWDNSIIAWGLRRYGFKEEAARLSTALLAAGRYFGGRLPGFFAGYDRERTRVPVPYRFTDSPYAPSSGATLLLLRVLLGLEPYDDHLAVDAAVPEEMGQIALLDVRGRWGYADALGRGRRLRDQHPPRS
ncbi:glycogen debranching N-terminal domain-containing protein [Micromonospora sp. SH-82]|uniref:glycogen debranching N-terminal domain-containing protein n=1 Tax=Micromonospora sp. SH-82 TaxID=3132938 RepID=UPI003EBB58FE